MLTLYEIPVASIQARKPMFSSLLQPSNRPIMMPHCPTYPERRGPCLPARLAGSYTSNGTGGDAVFADLLKLIILMLSVTW